MEWQKVALLDVEWLEVDWLKSRSERRDPPSMRLLNAAAKDSIPENAVAVELWSPKMLAQRS